MPRNNTDYPHLVFPLDDEKASTPMTKATSFLTSNGIPFRVKTVHHLKIGSLNYFPANGTLHRDADADSRKRVSLEQLLAIIGDEGA